MASPTSKSTEEIFKVHGHPFKVDPGIPVLWMGKLSFYEKKSPVPRPKTSMGQSGALASDLLSIKVPDASLGDFCVQIHRG